MLAYRVRLLEQSNARLERSVDRIERALLQHGLFETSLRGFDGRGTD